MSLDDLLCLDTVDLSLKQLNESEYLGFLKKLSENDKITSFKASTFQMEKDISGILFKSLESNTTLTHLNISYSRIDFPSLYRLFAKNNTLSNLEILTSQSRIEGSFFEALKSNTSITRLNISNNLFYDDDIRSLSEYLKETKALTSLKCNSNIITKQGIDYLCEGLRINTSLTHLYIGYCLEDGLEDGIKNLSESIKANNTLQCLSLEYGQLDEDGIKAIFSSLYNNKTIYRLEIGSNEQTESSALFIADVLKTNKSLEILDISNSYLRTNVDQILNSLNFNDTLTSLDISRNFIEESSSVNSISELLRVNASLTRLNLSSNSIGEGMGIIFSSLRDNCSLTTLLLENTMISLNSISDLSDMLHYNESLNRLDISCNHITHEHIKAISKGLRHNYSLVDLNIGRNDLGDEGVKYLSEVVCDYGNFLYLGLSENGITKKGFIYVIEILKHNPSCYISLYGNLLSYEEQKELSMEFKDYCSRISFQSMKRPKLRKHTRKSAI